MHLILSLAALATPSTSHAALLSRMTRISPALRMLALLCTLEGARAGLWCDATTTALDKVRLIKLRARRDTHGMAAAASSFEQPLPPLALPQPAAE